MSSDGATSTTFQGPPQYIQDYGRDFLGRASQVAQQPYEGYNLPRVSGLSPTQQGAIGNLGGLGNGTPYTDAAGGMLTQTLQGGGMNPYQDGVVDRTVNAATRAYQQNVGNVMDRFNTAGNWGGSAQQQSLGQANGEYQRNLMDGIAPIYQSGYENERARQMQAAGLASGLLGSMGGANMNALQAGGIEQGNNQSVLDSMYGDWNDWRNYPQQQLGIFGNALSQAMGAGGQQSTTQGPGPDRISQGIGTLALGRMLSGSGSASTK